MIREEPGGSEPDVVAEFRGGPNDGKQISMAGGLSAGINVPGEWPARYELEIEIWKKKGRAIYTWKPHDTKESNG